MNLHDQMMNLTVSRSAGNRSAAYRLGHRDARHAAAELALKADACIEALREIKAKAGDPEFVYITASKALDALEQP